MLSRQCSDKRGLKGRKLLEKIPQKSPSLVHLKIKGRSSEGGGRTFILASFGFIFVPLEVAAMDPILSLLYLAGQTRYFFSLATQDNVEKFTAFFSNLYCRFENNITAIWPFQTFLVKKRKDSKLIFLLKIIFIFPFSGDGLL